MFKTISDAATCLASSGTVDWVNVSMLLGDSDMVTEGDIELYII
jgi:hypothetical protein